MIFFIAIICQIPWVLGGDQFPPGHLQPFGGHRPSDVVIDEIYDIPDPQTFWDEYVAHGKAAILRGAAAHSPGYALWTEDYLSETYGDLEIRLEGKHESNSPIPTGEKGLGRDTLANFLRSFREKDTYIVSQLPQPMYKDISIPPCISCGNMRNRIVEVDLWMSSGNTHSIIHKDAFNAINCLIRGTKYWKLIEYKYEKWLYKAWEPKREIGGFSEVNAHSIDLIQYPDIAKVRWSNITINAGDCLFLPKSYYHQVSSYGDPNLAVSVLFSRIPNFDDTGCNETVIDFTPLSDVDVLWNWEGHGVMTMGNLDAWMVRANYVQFAKNHGQMTAEDLLEDMHKTMPEMQDDTLQEYVERAWEMIDVAKKGFLTEEDLLSLDIQRLRDHTLLLGLVEPSNTEDFEYSYVDDEHIERILEKMMEKFPSIQRKTFISVYIRNTGGTEKYANEIFDSLAGSSNDVVTRDQIEANMDVALEKWRKSGFPSSSPEIDNNAGYTELFRDEL